jgi:hypothetical protein
MGKAADRGAHILPGDRLCDGHSHCDRRRQGHGGFVDDSGISGRATRSGRNDGLDQRRHGLDGNGCRGGLLLFLETAATIVERLAQALEQLRLRELRRLGKLRCGTGLFDDRLDQQRRFQGRFFNLGGDLVGGAREADVGGHVEMAFPASVGILPGIVAPQRRRAESLAVVLVVGNRLIGRMPLFRLRQKFRQSVVFMGVIRRLRVAFPFGL